MTKGKGARSGGKGGKGRRRTVRHTHSAGGVAFRISDDAPDDRQAEVALIATNDGTRWQLPKGRLENDESSVEAAIREVKEETGLETVCEQFLTTVEYTYTDTYSRTVPELVFKKVDLYLLRTTGGELSDSSFEVDGVAWFSLDEALKILTFEAEKECLRLAKEQIDP